MKISIAPYRLLFRRPFTTAHGTRDGTDAVFVRIEHENITGYGEATLPPYLKESVISVAAVIDGSHLTHGITDQGSRELISEIDGRLMGHPAARNAVTMALFDIMARRKGVPLWAYWDLPKPPGRSRAMVTLATDRLEDVEERLCELPDSEILKVKLGTLQDPQLLELVKRLDKRPLLLDANQAFTKLEQVLAIL